MTRWVVQVMIKEKGDIEDEVDLEKSVSMIHLSKFNTMTLRKKKKNNALVRYRRQSWS